MQHLLATTVLALATATLAAQTPFDLDKTSAASLGSSLTLAVANAPANALLLSMPSFTAGPTPLSLIDPGDARSLQVGIELASAWSFALTGAGGTATINLSLPNNPALSGLIVHWQTATLPGATHLVDRLSNDVVAQLGSVGQARPLAATLAAARALAVVCADRDNNQGHGDVVIAGGGTGSLTNAQGLASSEIWDFRHLTRRSGPSMTTSRALHNAVELADGRTLIIGGVDALGAVLASCEIYDPASNSFTATGSMATPRVLQSACRLADGRVMVAGGTTQLSDTVAAITNVQSSVEIYNPTTGLWNVAPALGGRRLAVALTRLPNNNIMVSGGVQVGFLFGVPISAVSTTAVQFYNPSSGTWSSGPAMHQGRAGHHDNQVTLPNGRVLMTGGVYVPDLLNAANATPTNGAEYYDPAANSWTVANMASARSLHTATLLPNGKVVVCGGGQGTLTAPVAINAVEQFDPATNGWSPLPPLTVARASHVAVLQPDGLLVLFGGQGPTTTLTSIETRHF